MSKRLKVVHIINNLKTGGAENFLLTLLESLSKNKDIDLELVCLSGGGPLEEEIKKLPVSLKIFNYHLFVPILGRFDPYFRFSLYFYIKKIRPDIIHGHLIRGESFAKRIGGILKVPVVTTMHDVITNPRRSEIKLNKNLTKAVAVSDIASDYLEKHYKLPKSKITVIPDGIKMEDFEKSQKDYNPQKPVFIYLGRIIKSKGLEFAIKGLAKLKSDFPGLEFHIYGEETFKGERKRLEQLMKNGNWNFVKFFGRTENPAQALSTGDIFILPSQTEGFSMAILEAAASKKPVIATKTGAIPEMVEEGKSGYFVEYGSSEQIYEEAKQILQSGKVNQMGENGYNIVKDKFSIEKSAKMYYNLYLKLIENESD